LTLHGLPHSLEKLGTGDSELLEEISFDSVDFTEKSLSYYACTRLVEISCLFKFKPLEIVHAGLINKFGLCEFEGMEKSYIACLSLMTSPKRWMSPPIVRSLTLSLSLSQEVVYITV